MTKSTVNAIPSPLRWTLVAVACAMAAGCASVEPIALTQQDMQAQQQAYYQEEDEEQRTQSF